MGNEVLMEVFSKRLTTLVKNNQTDISILAERLGLKSSSTIYRYMNGQMSPKLSTIKYLAEIYGVNPTWLMGYDVPMSREVTGNEKFDMVPILGKIAAGKPITVEENIEGYMPVDPSIYGLNTSSDLFLLKVSGESMNKKVKNGDYALIHKQDYAENGDIIVAIVNGDNEATLKRYKQLNEQFVLLEPMSNDPTIESITVDLKTTSFIIIGKAIGHFGKF